jgi:CRISPR/Cas system CMR-associated protein Cmr3 (group 5 of RAMP superfamily)
MPDKPRWSGLYAEGKQIVLVGSQSKWVVFECASPEQASHIVRELWSWSKEERSISDFKGLCQAGG